MINNLAIKLSQFVNKNLIIASALLVALTITFASGFAVAQTGTSPNIQSKLCQGAGELQYSNEPGNCQTSTDEATDTVNSTVTLIINVFSWLVGVVSVIMIIWGGFKYITSGGESSNVTAAKNTILYAIIGLVIVALAQVIVKFVLGQATAE